MSARMKTCLHIEVGEEGKMAWNIPGVTFHGNCYFMDFMTA